MTPEEAASAFENLKSQFDLHDTPQLPELQEFDLGPPTSLLEFMREGQEHDYDVYDWVVPGLLERKDKMIITGQSGQFKSTLCRQTALCAAAGRYPFDRPGTHHESREYEPQKVALLDFENRPRQMYRGMANLLRRLENQYGFNCEMAAMRNLNIKVKEEGMELASDYHREQLLAWLEPLEPDLVIVGPLYYLTFKDPNLHENAQYLAKTLRAITTDLNAGLLIEAHSSKQGNGPARLDPQGSNIWTKWPDFGRSLQIPKGSQDRELFELMRFRGDREPRGEIPEYIRVDWASSLTPGVPTLPLYADYPEENW